MWVPVTISFEYDFQIYRQRLFSSDRNHVLGFAQAN